MEEKRFDEALQACGRLLEEWPDVVDGLERSGLVYEKMGEWTKAHDFYTRALAFTELPEQRDGFHEDARDYYRKRLADIDEKAQ